MALQNAIKHSVDQRFYPPFYNLKLSSCHRFSLFTYGFRGRHIFRRNDVYE